jgi:hypothetical protein
MVAPVAVVDRASAEGSLTPRTGISKRPGARISPSRPADTKAPGLPQQSGVFRLFWLCLQVNLTISDRSR